jgi:hypothetical protein
VLLRVYSEALSVEELTCLAGFKPTETLHKGTRKTDRSSPAPANAIFLSTESLVKEKDLNAHIRELGSRLTKGAISSMFGNDEINIYLTIYWWTTEEVGFYLDPECFDVLSKIGIPAYFHFLIDPSPINPTVEVD